MKGVPLILAALLLAGCGRAMQPGRARGIAGVHGNLHANDFEGRTLNSMGRAKIDAIPRDEPAILNIHLSHAVDRQVFVWRARDVKAYVKERGLDDAQIRFDPRYADDPKHRIFEQTGTLTACIADDNR
jgi:hypothetical protein